MPTKKKVTVQPKKKTSAPKASAEDMSQPKQDRPVMQVVQVPEGEIVPEVIATPQSDVSAPAISVKETPVVSVSMPSEAPVVSVEPVDSETPVENKTVSPETSAEPSNIVATPSGSTQTPAVPASPAETFAEELPPTGSSKKGLIVILIILLLVVCGAVGGYLYVKGGLKLPTTFSLSAILNMKRISVEKTTNVVPTVVVTPTPTSVTVNKAKYSIEVLNGSGIRGEAAKVKDSLITAGYTVATTGNASTSNYTKTEISAKAAVDTAFLTALRADLSKTYTVSSTVASLAASSTTDVVVTIGSQTAQ